MITDHQKPGTGDNRLNHFIHELNILKRLAALYPSTHPKTLAGADRVLAELAKLSDIGTPINLSIEQESLVVNDTHTLDVDNPSCRELVTFFAKQDLARISFHQGATASELIELLHLVAAAPRTGQPATTLEQRLAHQHITRIKLTFVDYGAFTPTGTGAPPLTQPANDDWSEFVGAALQSFNNREQGVSNRLTSLLDVFAHNAKSADRKNTAPQRHESQDLAASNLELLLLEDQHDEYMPATYQQALQKILAGNLQGNLSPDLAGSYRESIIEQMVERQCCDIIFDLLQNDIDTELEETMQNNLVDLNRFFLDTGDFKALRKNLSHWMAFINSGQSRTGLLREKVFSHQLKRTFMEDVLESVPVWQEDKFADICDYLAEIGEPYAELLIERLGNETDAALRSVWMKLLLQLGVRAHQPILESLHDDRWYLVRNLLVVLGQQKGGIPAKTVLQLCDHPHPKVRREALRILFRHNPSAANRQLHKELNSSDPETLRIMMPLLTLSNSDKSIHTLNKRLMAAALTSDTLALKLGILNALAQAPHPGCLAVVIDLAIRKELFRGSLQKQLEAAARATLARYPRRILTGVLPQLNSKQAALVNAILTAPRPTTAPESTYDAR